MNRNDWGTAMKTNGWIRWMGMMPISKQARPRAAEGMDADRLFRLWEQTGNSDYREGILHECDGLVIQQVRRLGEILPELRQDLYQAGGMAVCRAIENFDPGKQVKFTTFAYTYIKAGLLLVLQEGTLFGSRRAGIVIHAVNRAIQILEQEETAADEAAIRETLKGTGFTGDVERALAYLEGGVISCGCGIEEDGGDGYSYEPADRRDEIEAYINREAVEYYLSKIPRKRDAEILWRHCGLGESIKDLAREYHLSRQRVSSICQESCELIRKEVAI